MAQRAVSAPDVHGRALRDDGWIFESLYAAGNFSAPAMEHIYRGRATFGPAMTFDYLAALHWGRKGQSMPIDLDESLGAELPPAQYFWTSSDIQPYHLGLGAGSDPVNERNCATSPTTPAGAADVRRPRAKLPQDQAVDGAVSRYRHRAFQGAACRRGGVRAGLNPAVAAVFSGRPLLANSLANEKRPSASATKCEMFRASLTTGNAAAFTVDRVPSTEPCERLRAARRETLAWKALSRV